MSGEAFYTTFIQNLNIIIIMQLYIIVMSTYGNKTISFIYTGSNDYFIYTNYGNWNKYVSMQHFRF